MTRFSSALRAALAALVCAAAVFGLSGGGLTQAAAPSLIQAGDAPPQAAAQAIDPAVKRSRYITIDFDQLRAPGQRRLLREPPVTLALFPDVTIVARFQRFDPNPDGVTWVGRVDGVPMSSVTLSYSGGLMSGNIVMPAGVYNIRPASDAASIAAGPVPHIVSELNQSGLPPELPPIELDLGNAPAATADVPAALDTADVIDLLVVYTPLAASWAGGTTGIRNLINLGVSETNTSYINSGVNQRVRLVHAAEVPYVESSAFSPNLTNLRNGSGALSGVPVLRDTFGADLVMMIVHPTAPDACGIGFIMTSVNAAFAAAGFSVTDAACITNATMAHEMGHNMGARHDWYVDPGTTPFTYAHGFVNPAPGQRWRTIMAYVDRCSDQGFNCTRLLAWANPEKTTPMLFCENSTFNCSLLQYWHFPGAAMGVPGGTSTSCTLGSLNSNTCDADDRRALNNTALTVANFRQRTQPLTDTR